MANRFMTHLLCYDDHRSITEDIKKRFDDTSRYRVDSFLSFQDLIARSTIEKEVSSCKVALVCVPDAPEQFEAIGQFTADIRKADPSTGMILLGPPDKMDELKKVVRFNIDAYIPKNSNSVLRIHNTVKKLISEYSISIYRRRRNLSFYILFGFIILAAVLLLIARIRFPEYF